MKSMYLFVCLMMGLACCGSDTTPSATEDVAVTADVATPSEDAPAVAEDTPAAPEVGVEVDAPTASADLAQACYDESPSDASCKDCCDCQAALTCAERVTCRNTCTSLGDAHFAARADLPAYEAPSALGLDGDYASCLAVTDAQACKACCDCDGLFACGDMRHCRTACAAHTF